MASAGKAYVTKIDEHAVRSIDMERMRPFVRSNGDFFSPAGREHYRLLAYLSSCVFSQTIFDIGTNRGESAIALSHNESNVVHSFDLVDNVPPVCKLRENVVFHVENIISEAGREKWKQELLASAIIFLDVDPHDGEREFGFVEWLKTNGYRGLIVLDDIWYFPGMRRHLWYRIDPQYKRDLTALGHWSGTGIVSFAGLPSGDVAGPSATANWTLVTGYFDLTNRADASPEIKTRDSAHYLETHGGFTLSVDQNLVIFCDPGMKDRVLAMRPRSLHARTRVIEMPFDSFPLAKFQKRIEETRGGQGACARDPRNTASYYLFCMARFAMLKRVMDENPFQSSHFAWMNVCIERMGFANLARLDEALSQQRDKFSTCYIDYVSNDVLSSLPAFFGKDGCRDPHGTCGRCVVCSGFFTGNARYMREVCNRVEAKFVECLDAGYGHADEQLMALVLRDAPELFDWYIGDYQEMVTNYADVSDRPQQPLNNLIRNSMAASDFRVASRAADILWQSYAAGHCWLSDEELAMLLAVRKTCAAELSSSG